MSLRARLLIGMGVIALVLGVAVAVVVRITRADLIDRVDAQIESAVPQLGAHRWAPTEGPRLSNLYIGYLDQDGRLVTVSAPDLAGETAPTPVLDESDVAALHARQTITVPSDAAGTEYRVAGRTPFRQEGTGVVGLPLDDVQATVRRLVVVLGGAALAVLAVLGLVTWWVIRLGVRPVRRMTETAGAIAAGDLSARVPAEAEGTEAGDLGEALNAMLGRIEEAFDDRAAGEHRLRRFVADASHELRTPVATIRGYAELYRVGGLREANELDDAMLRTEQEAMRMGGLVDDLLSLARLDQGRPLQHDRLDLADLVRDALADARVVAPERTFEQHGLTTLEIEGDEARLRQVVGNLVGNALVHAPGATVRVGLSAHDGWAVLEVADDGPGMTEADAARAFERFYRADASRGRHQGGSGLGLSIVEAAVQAHGGRATVETGLDRGTTVRIELPTTSG